MTARPPDESSGCPACDSPSPLVRLLVQRPCDHAWHEGILADEEPRPVPDVKGAALCTFHARQVQETGEYEGDCDQPKWRGGNGQVYGCDTFTNPERAELYASHCAGYIDHHVHKQRLAELEHSGGDVP